MSTPDDINRAAAGETELTGADVVYGLAGLLELEEARGVLAGIENVLDGCNGPECAPLFPSERPPGGPDLTRAEIDEALDKARQGLGQPFPSAARAAAFVALSLERPMPTDNRELGPFQMASSQRTDALIDGLLELDPRTLSPDEAWIRSAFYLPAPGQPSFARMRRALWQILDDASRWAPGARSGNRLTAVSIAEAYTAASGGPVREAPPAAEPPPPAPETPPVDEPDDASGAVLATVLGAVVLGVLSMLL